MTGKGLDGRRLEEQQRPGVHAVTYYYSEEHLLVKSAQWFLEGLQSGEKCFFNLEPTLHEKFYKLLERLGVNVAEAQSTGQIQLFPFMRIYDLYRSGGYEQLVLTTRGMLRETLEEGFSGVRILGEANYGIYGVDPDNCFKWEADFDKLVLQHPLKSLCLYNLENLLQIIQEDSSFIRSTINSHQYIYQGGKTISSDDFRNQVLEGAN